ncbi:TetR/AcrR family transcriptional regulator [Amycolatopsis rhabdoformis]|uniref:TetR/AcrR family transcriptional regulator n=1 Tax=Amycolatopsis rhabdoformis TaxID=1448059 RepID=A0ABZ1I2F4_9PSEU|nr:TetR/AcrR family transcriptional regulator [Amycolatopsis rhabdoformis]WSE27971.1 TetR/AcrR family transcriptional regulator [Amycolatopsis rhabdoformis]
MPTKDSARRRRTLSERRQEIVTTAAELFDRHGYNNATMDDLAHAVGIAKPTLYHYFGSKEEILASIHEEFIDLLLGKHQRRRQAGLPPAQQLLEVMTDVLELMESHRGHVRVFFEHHRELPAAERDSIRDKRDAYEAQVAALIEQGTSAGTFRAVDPRIGALAVFGMCNWAYQWYRIGGSLEPRQIAYQFWDMFLRGIST